MTIKFSNINLREAVQKKIPVIRWLPRYKAGDILSDIVAGITVGLTLIPQAIAYAALAGLQPQYGLYSGFIGSLVYIFFGTVKQVNIGPTAVVSLLTYKYTHDTNPDFAILLCFLSGVVEFLGGLFHLGYIVEFISSPVTAGFSSAAALVIASSQVKGLLGIKIQSENFAETWIKIFQNLSETKPWDLTLSIGCCAALLAMRKLKDLKVKSCATEKLNGIMTSVTWLLSISRNAIVVISSAGLAYFLTKDGEAPFRLTEFWGMKWKYGSTEACLSLIIAVLNCVIPVVQFGTIQPGFPKVGLPPFSTTIGNQTYGFYEMCTHLGSGIIVVPLISLLNNVAIAKAFATEDVFDGNQEMMTLGLCNMIASCFRSMPVSGSFSRSSVNNASGVRTPLGGLYTGILVILSIGFLVPYFFYVPKATLASVIVCAVIFMVEFQLISHIWKANKRDLIPAFATFIACLWIGVEIGILVGLVFDILYLLHLNARPKCRVQSMTGQDIQHYTLLSPKSGILFSNVTYIRTKIAEAMKHSDLPLVVDCSHVTVLDFTAIQSLKATIKDIKKRKRTIIFYKLEEDLASLLSKVIGKDFFHLSTDLDQVGKEFFDNLRTSTVAESSLGIDIHKLKQKDFSTPIAEEINR